jgi:hypothetical protein
MIIAYSANALSSQFELPSSYVERCTPEDLAELAAQDHWRHHQDDSLTLITVIHLGDVDGKDLGLFEVLCEQCAVFTATLLGQVNEGGAERASLAASLSAPEKHN